MVDDIKKLRPELLDKSLAELRRQQDELALAIAAKEREAEVAAKETLAAEANKHIDAIVAGIKFLHENAIPIASRVFDGFKRGDGMLAPGMLLRNVSADQLVGGKADKPVRRRRKRNLDGTLG